MTELRSSNLQKRQRRDRIWEKPRLIEVGDLVEVIRGGGGKLTLVGGDQGDNRKPPGQG